MLNSANKLACSVLFVMAITPFTMAEPVTVRFAISTERVVNAMASAGMIVRKDQIELLSDVNSATPNATIRVLSVSNKSGGKSTVRAKLRCENHECLPFYVLVHGLDKSNEKSLEAHFAPATEGKLLSVVRGGDRATLILESPESRMSFPVICLQSGLPGQRIRVASLDHRRYYNAEIVAAGMLKGTL
jgi:hypothetical protein